MPFEPIAIVGQSCILPGALTPDELWDAVLAGADLEAADLEYANLEGAELEGVRNLQWARFLKTVNFQFARIGEEEKKIIREALWMEESRKRRLFGGSG